jgi:hypothetical protein
MKACIHFVGFRGDEYHSAVRIFGEPDFIHRYWDVRALGDVDPDNDVVVFARQKDWDNIKTPRVQAFDDSAVF